MIYMRMLKREWLEACTLHQNRHRTTYHIGCSPSMCVCVCVCVYINKSSCHCHSMTINFRMVWHTSQWCGSIKMWVRTALVRSFACSSHNWCVFDTSLHNRNTFSESDSWTQCIPFDKRKHNAYRLVSYQEAHWRRHDGWTREKEKSRTNHRIEPNKLIYEYHFRFEAIAVRCHFSG